MKVVKAVIIAGLIGVLALGVFFAGDGYKVKEYVIAFYTPEGENAYLVKTYKDGSPCNEPFKIITFTDTHLSGSMNRASDTATLNLIRNTIVQEKPDLIVICGDIVLGANSEPGARTLAALFEEHNQYWGFVLGNHDGENQFGPSREEFVELYSSYEHCIISSAPGIWGNGNCVVNIKDSAGGIIQSLVFIDSGDYLKEDFCEEYNFEYTDDYDFIKYDQIEWYKDEMRSIAAQNGKMPPSVMFMHIPLVEYTAAYNSALSEDKVIYGMRREEECSSPYNTGMFDAILEIGSTKAVVSGHDHINDYCVEYQGVKLLYSQSSSFGSYFMRTHVLYYSLFMMNNKNDRFSDGHTEFLIDKDGKLTITPLLNQDNPSLFEPLTQEQKEELNLIETLK